MRRLIPILTSLYPRPWRERYGEEFAALIEDLEPSLRTAFNIFTGALSMQIKTWSYGSLFGISALFAGVTFVALLLSLPASYVSSSTLRLNGSGAHFDQQQLDQFVEVTQRVESRANLTAIVASQNLYSKLRSRKPLAVILDRMRRDIKVEPMRVDSVVGFRVSMTYQDAQAAQQVVQALVADYAKEYVRAAQEIQSPLSGVQIASGASLPSKPEYPTTSGLALVAALFGLGSLSLLFLLRRSRRRRM